MKSSAKLVLQRRRTLPAIFDLFLDILYVNILHFFRFDSSIKTCEYNFISWMTRRKVKSFFIAFDLLYLCPRNVTSSSLQVHDGML